MPYAIHFPAIINSFQKSKCHQTSISDIHRTDWTLISTTQRKTPDFPIKFVKEDIHRYYMDKFFKRYTQGHDMFIIDKNLIIRECLFLLNIYSHTPEISYIGRNGQVHIVVSTVTGWIRTQIVEGSLT